MCVLCNRLVLPWIFSDFKMTFLGFNSQKYSAQPDCTDVLAGLDLFWWQNLSLYLTWQMTLADCNGLLVRPHVTSHGLDRRNKCRNLIAVCLYVIFHIFLHIFMLPVCWVTIIFTLIWTRKAVFIRLFLGDAKQCELIDRNIPKTFQNINECTLAFFVGCVSMLTHREVTGMLCMSVFLPLCTLCVVRLQQLKHAFFQTLVLQQRKI